MQTTVESAAKHTGDFVLVTRTYGARGFRMRPDESIDCAFAEFSREGREPLLITVQDGQRLARLTSVEDGKLYACTQHEGVPYAVMLLEGSWQYG